MFNCTLESGREIGQILNCICYINPMQNQIPFSNFVILNYNKVIGKTICLQIKLHIYTLYVSKYSHDPNLDSVTDRWIEIWREVLLNLSPKEHRCFE